MVNFILWVILIMLIIFGYKILKSIILPSRVVLVSSRTKYIEKVFLSAIKKYIPSSHEMNFIELGSGYAHITKIAARNFKWKSIIALEIDSLVLFWTKFKNYFQKLPITFVCSNALHYNIPKNSVIYCYMSVFVLNALYKANAFNGSLLLSLSFAIPEVEPLAEYKIKGFQKRLYVYDFR